MKKPKLCVEPEETQDEYCMTDADLGNLTNLLQQANDICDYYQDMIQNRLGLLCVANAEAHDELIAQVESFRDTVFGMRRIFIWVLTVTGYFTRAIIIVSKVNSREPTGENPDGSFCTLLMEAFMRKSEVRAPYRCLSCVYLSTSSGKAYCPFAACLKRRDEKPKDDGGKEHGRNQVGRIGTSPAD